MKIYNRIHTWPRGLISSALSQKASAYSGVRRIIQNFHWTTYDLPQLTYEDLGYTKAKERQLVRNYYDPKELERVRSILERRAKKSGLTSVSASLRGEKKDSRSMGHCMLSLTVSRLNGIEAVDINYRSTELIFKFGADLVFLQRLFNELGINPGVIRFHFANAFISGGYLGTLGQFWDLEEFLPFLKQEDEKFFKSGTRVLLRSALEKNQTYRYSPHNQQHKLIWRVYKPDKLKRITSFLNKSGVIAEVPRDDNEGDEE